MQKETIGHIIWIIVGIATAIYIVLYNIKMQKITNKMIDIIDDSSKKCKELVKKVKECQNDEELKRVIMQLEAETLKFHDYKKDKKNWPLQSPRIMRHIKEIRAYIIYAKDYKNIRNTE